MMSRMAAEIAGVDDAGGCVGCSETAFEVYRARIGGLEIRLCESCKRDLLASLRRGANADAKSAGGCVGCSRPARRVHDLRLGRLAFRLCRACADDLAAALRAADRRTR